MTLTEAIAICDKLRPGNRYDNDLKTRWINELQGMIHVQVHLTALNPMGDYLLTYPAQEGDVDPELDIPTPYDRMYWLYLCAMVDFANGDYDKYNNTYELFNRVLNDYKVYYISTCEPGLWTNRRRRLEGYAP